MLEPKISRKLLLELPILEATGVLDIENGERLRHYLQEQSSNTTNLAKLSIIFISIIGSLLIGGGIILLFAHNWDELGRPMRAVISITPLIIGIALGFYVIIAQKGSTWREGTGIFLSVAALAALGLICQTYNLGGELADFYFIVLLMTLPLAWVFNSTATVTLWLMILSCWSWEVASFWHNDKNQIFWFWPMFVAGGSYLIHAWRQSATGMRTYIAWLMTIFVLVVLGPVMNTNNGDLIFYGYFSFYCVILQIGSLDTVVNKLKFNPFTIIGRSGALIMCLVATNKYTFPDCDNYSTLFAIIFPLIAAIFCLIVFMKKRRYSLLIGFFPIITFFIGAIIASNDTAVVILSLILALYGGVMLWEGTVKQSMLTLNSGMILICLIALIRFADSKLSIIFRALAFIVTGMIFLGINLMLMLKKNRRKSTAKELEV
jgi:uncharacterized membrane protein